MNNIELLQRLVEESTISDRQCAELTTLLNQVSFYVLRKAALGDLYAKNLVEQMTDGRETAKVI